MARDYKKLRSGGFSALAAGSVWEGRDHLLLVQSYRVVETYKRFYYRDIQAILVTETQTAKITAIVLAVAGVLIGLTGLLFPVEGMIAMGVLAALFLAAAIAGFLRGPSCRCTLRTAVQTQRLPLNRLRAARKVILRLRPLIEAAQSSTPPVEPATP